MSKEESNGDLALGFVIIAAVTVKWILEVLTIIFKWINYTAWSLSGSLGRFVKFVEPAFNFLAIILTLTAICWAVFHIRQYVNRITDFRGLLDEKVSELKYELFKEVRQIRESLSDKAQALEQQQHEFEQKTTALMESVEARLKMPTTPIEAPALEEGIENSDSNALPR